MPAAAGDLAFEGFQAWLLTRDWCHEVTAYIKQSGPPAQRVMIPADQTLVVKGVPEDKKELIVLALQKQTAGIMGMPNFVPDKAGIAAIGAPAQFHCYANYVDAQRCLAQWRVQEADIPRSRSCPRPFLSDPPPWSSPL